MNGRKEFGYFGFFFSERKIGRKKKRKIGRKKNWKEKEKKNREEWLLPEQAWKQIVLGRREGRIFSFSSSFLRLIFFLIQFISFHSCFDSSPHFFKISSLSQRRLLCWTIKQVEEEDKKLKEKKMTRKGKGEKLCHNRNCCPFFFF